ncbi:hillarin-like isoform X1 [Mytilus californianus]|uniref:hillarin-like isoform X1 n=2 Tax=Mytilus californianus TaxID=6549 RepID=UPI0022478BDC|nr:hillarin-like isoform X1 [Mytilus californianus]
MTTASEERGYRRLSSIFQAPILNPKSCHRCKGSVFQAEKMGPVHDVLFHKACFKCVDCGTHLNIKNYFSNQLEANDREIYCHAHVPRVGAAKYDKNALGIKQAVDVQTNYKKHSRKLNPQIRKAGTIRNPSFDYQAMAIRTAVSAPSTRNSKVIDPIANIDANALHIKGAIDAQLLTRGNQLPHDKHHFPPNIYKKRQRLIDAQKKLEEELRKEEDAVIDEMMKKRSEENNKISEEIKKEWEVRLKELTEKFDREMGKKSKKLRDSEKKLMTVNFENQKRELGNIIERKKAEKKQNMTIRVREKEQRKMANLVEKQSQQMLQLLAAKQEELKQEVAQELPTNGDIAEPDVIENVMEALNLEVTTTELPPPHPPSCRKKDLFSDVSVFNDIDNQVIQVAKDDHLTYTDMMEKLTGNLPNDIDKARAIYRWITVKDLNIMEFEEAIDSNTPLGLLKGIKFGTETYHVLFMRLCSYAGLHCNEIKGHSKSVGYEPGMKIEPESFQNTWNAVLIDGDWRLVQCNWGARHLVLNKDKKKSDSPREKEKEKREAEKKEQERKEAEKREQERKEAEKQKKEGADENDGENGDATENGKGDESKVNDTIRYQYDEHYFLTDPDEFIQEFWPNDPDWQLLEKPITKEEFEQLPFVRSVFFHFGMHFDRGLKAVIETSDRGGCDVRLKVNEKLENDIVFFYQLRFADKERRHEAGYRGAYLERFVYMTMIDNTVMFSVHVPTPGEYFFEVFANRLDEAEDTKGTASDGVVSSFRLKCACKFKIVCKTLVGKMHPLPECAAGEWGPKKGKRHFGIKAISVKHQDKDHETISDDSSETTSLKSDTEVIDTQLKDTPDNPKGGIVNVNETVDLVFKLTKPLQFVIKLRMNSVDSKALDPFVHHTVENRTTLRITVSPPQTGQYGIDVYARPLDSHDKKLSHAFKYLLNCLKVTEPVDIPKIRPKTTTKRDSQWGPSPMFEELGMRTVSHTDAKIECSESNQITIELFVPRSVSVSHQFLREPGGDIRDQVAMARQESNPEKTLFKVNLPETGNYMLAIYARLRDGETRNLSNVYNYLIVYRKSAVPETVPLAKPGDRKSSGSSIFRKGLFKKSEKDKQK